MHEYEHDIYQTNEHLNFEIQYQYNQKYFKMSISNFRKKSDIFWFIIFSMQKARLGCVVWVLHKSGGQKERQAPIFQVWISLYTALLQSRLSRLYFLPTNSCLQLAPNSKCIYNFNASEIRFDRIYKLVLGMPWGRRYESLTWTHVITPENAIYGEKIEIFNQLDPRRGWPHWLFHLCNRIGCSHMDVWIMILCSLSRGCNVPVGQGYTLIIVPWENDKIQNLLDPRSWRSHWHLIFADGLKLFT